MKRKTAKGQDSCFLRQRIPQPEHLSTSDGSFGALSASSAGTSELCGTVPLPLASTPPETPEPQASEPDNSGKTGRGYGKWGEEQDKLLVQLSV